MRILMVAPEQFPLPGSGSVEICMVAVARQLAREHEVTVVCRRSPGRRNVSREGGVSIVRVPAGGKRRYLAAVSAYMRGRRFDLIQVDNRPLYMARIKAKFPRTRVALFLHSLTFVPATKRISRSLGKADVIIANSASLRQRLRKRFPNVAGKIRSVHPGVDIDRFAPPTPTGKAEAKAGFGIPWAFAILYAGRVIPRKGVDVAIKAMRRVKREVPDAGLVVAGKAKSRRYAGKLRRLAAQNGVPVRFIGGVPHRNMPALYRAADCFVCPSQKHEAFGLVNVEAMAAGVPVVASRIGGIREIVEHGKNGYLVGHYRSPRHFAAYVIRIAKHPALWRRLSHNARSTAVAKFQWKRTADKMKRIYRMREADHGQIRNFAG